VQVVKGYVGRRPATWYSLTDEGHDRFTLHKQTLSLILGD
jgi:hypothetical protein